MSRSSQKKKQQWREKECSRKRACMNKDLNRGHEYGACLEGPKGKLKRKKGEDEHERRTL